MLAAEPQFDPSQPSSPAAEPQFDPNQPSTAVEPAFDPSQPSTLVARKPDLLDRVLNALSRAPASQREEASIQTEAAAKDAPLLTISSDTVNKLLPDAVYELLGKEGTEGVADALSGAATGLTKPSSLALIPAAIVAPQIVGGVLAGMGAKQLGESAGAASVAIQMGQTREAAKLTTEALLSGMQAALGPATALHAPRSASALTDAAAHIVEIERITLPAAPVEFLGVQERLNKPSTRLYNLTEDVAGLGVKGSTVSETALREHGLVLPPEQPVNEPVTAAANAEQRLGILPPGSAEVAAVARESATKLDRLRQGFQNFLASDPVRQDIVRSFDAADNQAKIEGEQVGNSVRLDLPNEMDRKAAMFVIEANGDAARLQDFEQQAITGANVDALEAIRHARDNWDRLAPAAKRIGQLQDQQLAYEQANGIDPGNHEAYVKHAYDMDVKIGRGRPVVLNAPASAKGLGTAMMKQRTFATYADAIEAGYKPKTLDIADLVQSRVTAGERLVNRNQWANALSDVRDPVEGSPIITSVVTQQPKGTQVAPLGYVRAEIIPGVAIAIHEGYAPLIDSLMAPSRWPGFEFAGMPVGKITMGTEGFVKHGMLLIDTFHAGRMVAKELALTGQIGHDLGRSLLEYSDADLARAVEQKQITQQAADFARARRPDAELLTANGLNVGRISDALNRDVLNTIEKLPGLKGVVTGVVKPFNRWVFDKLTRGAMLHSGLMELDRLRKAMPEKTDTELAGIVASNMNTYYGNLGKQGFIKDATFQDIARILFLAPQWVEGMARTEFGAYGQALKIPFDLANGRSLVVGPLAKGVGQGVMALVIATQLINLASRGHLPWQNTEHGHQMDAWIPDLTGKGHGFWLSPLGMHAELTHDALRYYSENPEVIATAARIINNKASPLVHAAEILFTGTDWNETHLNGDWNRAMGSLTALNPSPLPLQSLFKDGPPGSLQRQITASLGIKTELVQSADTQIYSALSRYNTAHGIKNEPITSSPYRTLNNALRNENQGAAQKAYDELLKQKSEKAVLSHYHDLIGHLYTGSRMREAAFRASLTEDQQALLETARQEREQQMQRFFKFIEKRKP